MLVYLSAPSLLGTVDAHPMSVALRGAPPCRWRVMERDDDTFTLCKLSRDVSKCSAAQGTGVTVETFVNRVV